MRFPSKPLSDPPPVPKPPVPRAKSSALLMSAERPGLDVRRSTFPGKLRPLNLGSKSPFLAGLKEPKPSPPPPPTKDTFSAGSPTGLKAGMTTGREDMDWFAGDCDRKTAEDRLLRINKDGAFLVRHSKAQSSGQPYTLAVLYKGKVYNIPVRYLEETRVYALGKEGKKNEEFFSSLQDIISYHKNNQLLLIDSKSQAKHTTYLTHSARR
ncbi:SH2 domain-containing protein 6 [Osmerus eperlanus]|uniref:SH2 domain-containing protein 6 n=1 Tax=Osmerus eperlanus TaxID=29151 RepID=UPI002E110024